MKIFKSIFVNTIFVPETIVCKLMLGRLCRFCVSNLFVVNILLVYFGGGGVLLFVLVTGVKQCQLLDFKSWSRSGV